MDLSCVILGKTLTSHFFGRGSGGRGHRGGRGRGGGRGHGGGRGLNLADLADHLPPLARPPGIHFLNGVLEMPTGDRSHGTIPNIVIFFASL